MTWRVNDLKLHTSEANCFATLQERGRFRGWDRRVVGFDAFGQRSAQGIRRQIGSHALARNSLLEFPGFGLMNRDVGKAEVAADMIPMSVAVYEDDWKRCAFFGDFANVPDSSSGIDERRAIVSDDEIRLYPFEM